jgi:hypothetical protein
MTRGRTGKGIASRKQPCCMRLTAFVFTAMTSITWIVVSSQTSDNGLCACSNDASMSLFVVLWLSRLIHSDSRTVESKQRISLNVTYDRYIRQFSTRLARAAEERGSQHRYVLQMISCANRRVPPAGTVYRYHCIIIRLLK